MSSTASFGHSAMEPLRDLSASEYIQKREYASKMVAHVIKDSLIPALEAIHEGLRDVCYAGSLKYNVSEWLRSAAKIWRLSRFAPSETPQFEEDLLELRRMTKQHPIGRFVRHPKKKRFLNHEVHLLHAAGINNWNHDVLRAFNTIDDSLGLIFVCSRWLLTSTPDYHECDKDIEPDPDEPCALTTIKLMNRIDFQSYNIDAEREGPELYIATVKDHTETWKRFDLSDNLCGSLIDVINQTIMEREKKGSGAPGIFYPGFRDEELSKLADTLRSTMKNPPDVSITRPERLMNVGKVDNADEHQPLRPEDHPPSTVQSPAPDSGWSFRSAISSLFG